MAAPAPPPTPAALPLPLPWSPPTRLSLAYASSLLLSPLLFGLAPRLGGYVALVPAKALPYATTLLSTSYCDASMPSAVVSALAIVGLCRHVEPSLGTLETLKTIALANLCGALLTWLWLVFAFAVTQRTDLLYANVTGAYAAIAALVVALKQVAGTPAGSTAAHVPAQLLPFVPYAPAALLGATTLISAAAPNALPVGMPSNILGGTIASWVYLRYFRVPAAPTEALGAPGAEPYSAVPGDASAAFSAASCLPPAMSGALAPLDRLANRLFGPGGGAPAAGASLASGLPTAAPLPGSDSEEARRRRERGARALEERLAQAAASKAAKDRNGAAV